VTLTFDSMQAGWWPYVFIAVAGVLATEVWRWLGVLTGGALREESEALIWVKSVATALVAGVVGQLITLPTGQLANAPIMVRIAAAAFGWLAFRFAKKSVLAGVATAEAVLIVGWIWLG
jgi:hypothetical protein